MGALLSSPKSSGNIFLIQSLAQCCAFNRKNAHLLVSTKFVSRTIAVVNLSLLTIPKPKRYNRCPYILMYDIHMLIIEYVWLSRDTSGPCAEMHRSVSCPGTLHNVPSVGVRDGLSALQSHTSHHVSHLPALSNGLS